MTKPAVLLMFFLLGRGLIAQQRIDSSEIVRLYTVALSEPEKRDSVLSFMEKSMAHSSSDKQLLETYDYQKARFLLRTGEQSSAVELSKQYLKSIQDSTDMRRVKFLNLVAGAHMMNRDYEEGFEFFEQSLRVCDANGDNKQGAYVLNNIANTYFSLLDYQSAYKFLEQALDRMEGYEDDHFYPMMLAILSVAESNLEMIDEAKAHALNSLELAEKKNDLHALILSTHALGNVYLKEESIEESIAWLSRSLTYCNSFPNPHYLMLNHIALLTANMESGKYHEGLSHGKKALELSENLGNLDVRYSIHQKMARCHAELGEYDQAYTLLKAAHELFKTSVNEESQEAINNLLVKYDTERTKSKLAQKEVKLLEEQSSSRLFKLWVIALVGLFLVFSLVVLFWRSRSRQKMRALVLAQKMENLQARITGEEKERRRLGTDLHDGLSSQLTSVRYQLEALQNIDTNKQKKIVQLIQESQEEARRIAHNLSPLKVEEFGLLKAIQTFAHENSTDSCAVLVNALSSNFEISRELELLIYRTVQELTQNALKHASASEIVIQLMEDNNEIHWSVEDDGSGFDVKKENMGEGIRSIEKRVGTYKGSFNIDSNEGGTIVQLSISKGEL